MIMAFDINQYKLKHIVSLRSYLIEDMYLTFNVDGTDYDFKIVEAGKELIELAYFSKYDEIKRAFGPIEKEIKNITYGKTASQMKYYEKNRVYNSTFRLPIDGKQFEFEITGVGPVAIKLSLFLRYDHLENGTTDAEISLRNRILNRYVDSIENSESYQKQLDELKKEYDEQQAKQKQAEEEAKREEEEKIRKRKELEEFLNRNKPKNDDKPFRY